VGANLFSLRNIEMLVQVMKSKLVLGKSIYKKGDVFECRDAEAKMLIVVGMLKAAAPDAKISKAPPQPQKIGISLAKGPGPKVSAKQSPKPPGNPVGAMLAPEQPTTAPQPEAKKQKQQPAPGHPVGEMQMPEQSGKATDPRPWVK
jgi:hypothetical protein